MSLNKFIENRDVILEEHNIRMYIILKLLKA